MSDSNDNNKDDLGSRRSSIAGDAPLIQPKKQGLFSGLWSNFLAGVVVAAPIGITVWLFYLLITGPMARLDAFVKSTLPVSENMREQVLQVLPGVGVLVAIMALVLLGALAKNFVGRSFIRAGEQLFESIPIIRNVFGFFKNVFETALRQSDRSFKEVALVEYPRKGAWVMAFVVGDTKGEVLSKLDETGDHLTSIFIPTVPNPTSGFLLFVPRKDLKILEMSVEEAAKVVFSLGLVVPDYGEGMEAVKRLEALADEAVKKKTLRERLFKSWRA